MSKNKNKIKGLIKSKHFKKRQLERQVSDKHVLKALNKGSVKEVEGHYRITLEELHIIVDDSSSTLITVHPGDAMKNRAKVLSKEEAQELKKIIETNEKEIKKTDEIDDFSKYIQENQIKKIT